MLIPMVVGNWKMNKTVAETQELAEAIADGVKIDGRVRVIVCPPFVALTTARAVFRLRGVGLGAQNLHYDADGAFTGEISASMLAKICQYVIVGHSERRTLFGETDDVVNLKIKAAQNAGLRPILCIGENLEQRSAGNAEAVVEAQLKAALNDVRPSVSVIVAYEPVWAIGTGQSATPQVAQAMMSHIRKTLTAMYGPVEAAEFQILYGGSVNPSNTADYIRQSDVNGVLVGSASIDAEAFTAIVAAAATAND